MAVARPALPSSLPPASRTYVYDETTCPTAHKFLETLVRWSTFCEKYEPEHCELGARVLARALEALVS